jgi:hypothetical protein
MAVRRVNPSTVKLHRSYDAGELAALLGVHKNTVKNWQREGLCPIDGSRPTLFQGAVVRAFLASRNKRRKSPCSPGTFYCFRCRAPRPPALGMVDFIPINARAGNLRALCGTCEATMHRRAPLAQIAAIMPDCDIQVAEAEASLSGSKPPSLTCDFTGKATKR